MVSLLALTALLFMGLTSHDVQAQSAGGRKFTTEFGLDRCDFAATGSNTYFVLEPGYEQILRGTVDGVPASLTIDVLPETRRIAGVETRVIQERHTLDGALVEVSRNYFAICRQTNSVFYFGEDVDMYSDGKIVAHTGAWRAGANGARAGLYMPGIVLIGARYVQEVAPGVAQDQAEILSIDEVVQTPAGRFRNVVATEETSALDPTALDHKFYAPGIGLIQDDELKLVSARRQASD